MSAVTGVFDTDTSEQMQRYFGKYPGRVLENGPPEDGDHRGELLVEVPGILEEAPDGSGDRALQAVAKPCFPPGFFFVPAVGDHVWVEFVAGEIEFPVWTGVWYPADAVPRAMEDQAPTERQWILRTPGGHLVQLDDTDDDPKLVILHQSEAVLTLDKDGNIAIENSGGAKIELKDDTVTVTAEITLDGNVHITGDTQVDGVLTVGTGPKTTIDENEIKGG